jgi:uncharacterized protein YeaO (DUF488 family)
MTLYTKSIKAKRSDEDGIRICVMRRIRPYYQFDIWVPALAPSEELLTSYQRKRISWDEYEERYRGVLETQRNIVEAIGEMAASRNVTLLCTEATPEKCHRRLLAEECRRYHRKLKVVLK